jgi:uncharacterized protein YraI
MNRAGRSSIVIAFVLLGFGSSPAIVMAHGLKSEGTYVTTGPVSVKAGPSDEHKTVRKFRKGTKFEVIGTDGAWLKIQLSEHGKHFGYLDQRFAAIKDHHATHIVPRPAIPAAYVTTAPISVRQGPGEHFPVVATPPAGTRIMVLRLEGDWLRIASRRNGPPAYVSRQYTFLEHAD